MNIEEAIKILTNADYLMNIQIKTSIGNRVAIETLVNADKELHKENEGLKVLLKGNLYDNYLYYKDLASEYQGSCVSKQTIRDKIKEYQDKYYIYEEDSTIDILDELLGE